MNLFYAVWDYGERRLFPRQHPSCCENLTASIGMSPDGESICPRRKLRCSVGTDLARDRMRDVRCVAVHRHAAVPGKCCKSRM